MKKTMIPLILAGVFFCAPRSYGADATEVYQQNCSKCHGADGKGQTTVGRKLKVPDFTDAGWKSQTSDAKIKEAIENGVKDKSGKELMIPYKEKLTPGEIDSLISYVQKFGISNP